MALQWLWSVFSWGTADEEATPEKKVVEEDWEELTMEGKDAELRLILVGKSGSGKSATGNTILCREEFKSILAGKTVTQMCQRGQGSWQGTKLFVVDTPALFDLGDGGEVASDEIRACVELSRPGPHALILVTQVGRFTAEDVAAAKRVRDIFGSESTRHTIVLFTCVEDLGGTPLQEYIHNSDNGNLRQLIWRCRNRVCGFNNKVMGAERERQVEKLIAMVQRTVSENGGQYYTGRLYSEPNLRDEDIRMLSEQDQLADRLKYFLWISRERILSAGRFLFSFLNDGPKADRGPPQLTAIQHSDGPEKSDL